MRRVLWIVLAVGAIGADWPQWRGPHRDGIWHEKGLPDKLPAEVKPRWKQPIGGGYSGIAVTGGRVYTMDRQKEPKEVERVLCLDAATGKAVWTHDYPVAYGKLDYGNGPRCTPTVHDGKVYTFGATGVLHCLDAIKGTVVWSRDTIKDFDGRRPEWGHACSPLVDGDRLVLQVGGRPDACLVALDKDTGKEVWRSSGDRPGYASPVVMKGPKYRQIVYFTPDHVFGVDADTGKQRWEVPVKMDYDVAISDVVYHDGVVLASNYWTGSKAIKLNDNGEKPEIVWEGDRLSLLMSTPLLRDGHLYALDRHKGLKCVELKTGEVKWDGGDVTPRGRNPQASLVWAGDRALILNSKGDLLLAELTPKECKVLGKKSVVGGTWAHPAFADGCVFARTDEEIVCVPLK